MHKTLQIAKSSCSKAYKQKSEGVKFKPAIENIKNDTILLSLTNE